jgi:small-conductance mechanosensitive channel
MRPPLRSHTRRDLRGLTVPAFGGISGYVQHAFASGLSALTAPVVLTQIVVVAVALFLGLWLGTRFERALKKLTLALFPHDLVLGVGRLLNPISAPLIVLFVLWGTLIVAGSLGESLRLVHGAASLVAAWIVIRFASQVLRSAWAVVVAAIAWGIAALSILGLLGAVASQLDASALTLGRVRFSALTAIRGLFALAVLLWLTMLLSDFLQRRIGRAASLTPAMQTALIQIARLLLPVLAVVASLAIVGIDLTALAVFSGAIGIGIGLGLQQTMSNFVAGLSLVLGKTIQPGDVIGYGKNFGWVTQMGTRYVSIRTRDGIAHHLPNSHFITNGVENWSHFGGPVRLHVAVGIAYEADLPRAIELCLGAARSVKRILEKPEPVCLVTSFGDSAIYLDLRIWINDPPAGVTNVKSAVMLEIWDRFKKEGIRFPFPQRDVHLVPAPRDSVLDGGPRRDILHS